MRGCMRVAGATGPYVLVPSLVRPRIPESRRYLPLPRPQCPLTTSGGAVFIHPRERALYVFRGLAPLDTPTQ